ncbi:multidrug ABC transporter [Desulfitobacterium hafniense]|uniref:Multidrug ABC transporter n=1 Tax=Desulfitobacterium hafniense TaxID=49338 RepID=A0A0W1JQP8_DESHA|nr:EamA family transporter [Desulfitobacterium hafniense]KTE93858.1 multidrug ABC transporter [Desulfitobacterium hafniense]
MGEMSVHAGIFIFSVFISSISQIMLKKSALKNYDSKIKEYINPLVITAYSVFFISSLLTMFAYKYVPLSIGPILESTGYIFVGVLSYIFLKERINARKLAGMIIILLGIIVAYINL